MLNSEIKRFGWKYAVPVFILYFFLGQTCAWAFIQNYTPLDQSDLRSRFKLKFVSDGEALKKGKELTVAGCRLKLKNEDVLEITGQDSDGKAWLVATGFSGLGTAIFTGDLDNNGIEDIVIIGVTGGCGWAPPRNFDSILLDQHRRPRLWGVQSYVFGDRNPQCYDLFKLGHDPRAVIVVESIVYHSVGDKDYSYWRTLLYRAENGGWQLLPQYRGHLMPLMVRFRFKSNHELAKVPPVDIRSFQNASTSAPSQKDMKEVTIKEIKSDDDGKIATIDFGSGPAPVDSANDWYYGTTVYRQADNLFSAAAYSTDLACQMLKDAASHKNRVKIPAATRPGCLPTEVWIIE